MRQLGPNHLGMLMMSIGLIPTGLLPILPVTFPSRSLFFEVLAFGAGVLLLLGRSQSVEKGGQSPRMAYNLSRFLISVGARPRFSTDY